MPLLNPPSVILAQYIRAEGLMSDPADDTEWPLYISYKPDIKTKQGTIEDDAGAKHGRYMEDGFVVQHYGITLRIRSRVYNTGWAKMEAILTNLDTIAAKAITVNSVDYIIQNVSRTEPFGSPGAEDGTKKRRMFVSNLLTAIRRV